MTMGEMGPFSAGMELGREDHDLCIAHGERQQ